MGLTDTNSGVMSACVCKVLCVGDPVMKVLPLFAVVYCSGVILILANAPQGPWTNGQTFWMNWGALALIGMFAMSAACATIRKVPETYRFSFVAVLVMVAAAGWTYRDNITKTVISVVADAAPLAAVADTSWSTALPRRWDGHFRANALVNGTTIDMLVDTGASVVLLRHIDAANSGIDMASLEFNVPILTANGKSHVASIILPEVNIGGVSVKNVDAAVAEPGQLHASLLGMSFLGEIEEAVIRKDRLILRN